MQLRRIAEVDVRRRLLAVEGISQVVAIGGDQKQYQILLDPMRMEPHGLTTGDIVEAVERGSGDAPGGFVVDRGQESVVRVLGRAHTAADLGAIVLRVRDDVPIRVRDVAEVRVGPAVSRGTASHQARPAVILSVVKQPDADTVATTTRVDAALDELGEDLARRDVELHRDVFRQQDFIDRAIENLLRVLRDGALFVAAVLFVFLWSARPTLISLTAIPLSLVVAVLALDVLGLRIDTMTLGGLAIAIGEIVDDAIVDVENCVRRLRERMARPATPLRCGLGCGDEAPDALDAPAGREAGRQLDPLAARARDGAISRAPAGGRGVFHSARSRCPATWGRTH
jgi:Cu/Ag efflux pump CusA